MRVKGRVRVKVKDKVRVKVKVRVKGRPDGTWNSFLELVFNGCYS